MEITLEQVERLREKADVSYGQAKQALEYSGGNLLDALIYLEEQGAIPRPQGAYYSTRNETPPPPPSQEELAPLGEKTDGTEQRKKKKFKGMGVKVVSGKTLFGTLRRWLIDNELEIWRRGQPVTSRPGGHSIRCELQHALIDCRQIDISRCLSGVQQRHQQGQYQGQRRPLFPFLHRLCLLSGTC